MNVTQPGLQSAWLGLQKGQQQVNQAAAEIAQATSSAGGADLTRMTTAVVELKQGELQFEASAKALKVQNDLLGALLDETA